MNAQDTVAATTTPAEAVKLLAAMEQEYSSALTAKENAEKDLGDVAAAKAAIDEIRSRAVAIAAAMTPEKVSPMRAGRLIFAASSGLRSAEVKKIAEANRTSAKDANGIVLPAGRFQNLSRGKGWCRLGSGNSVRWADRTDGGYLADTAGNWTVGSSDGFSRKDSVSWKVEQVGPFWIAN